MIEKKVSKRLEKRKAVVEKEPEKFTRLDYLKKVIPIPKSNNETVIIPSNDKGTGFLETCYDHNALKGVLTKAHFDKVV